MINKFKKIIMQKIHQLNKIVNLHKSQKMKTQKKRNFYKKLKTWNKNTKFVQIMKLINQNYNNNNKISITNNLQI